MKLNAWGVKELKPKLRGIRLSEYESIVNAHLDGGAAKSKGDRRCHGGTVAAPQRLRLRGHRPYLMEPPSQSIQYSYALITSLYQQTIYYCTFGEATDQSLKAATSPHT